MNHIRDICDICDICDISDMADMANQGGGRANPRPVGVFSAAKYEHSEAFLGDHPHDLDSIRLIGR